MLEKIITSLPFILAAIAVFSLVSFFVLRAFCAPIIAKWMSYALGLSLFFGACVFVGFSKLGIVTSGNSYMLVIIGVLICINIIVTPIFYWLDKRWARLGNAPRIPEKALHGLAIFGGAIGAVASQRIFHHKTRKRNFQIVTWLAVVSSVAIYYFVFSMALR